MAMTELETLLVTVEADLRRYSKQMQQLGQMTEGGFKRAGKAANDGLSTVEQRARDASRAAQEAMQAAQRSSRQFGAQLQNVGYQVGDFFVQIEGGQGVIRALTQQGSQVLGAFGPWGAVLGAAAGALGALLSASSGYTEAADRAKVATEGFADAQAALKGVLTASNEAFIDAKGELSLLEQGYKNLAGLSIFEAIRKNNEAIAKSLQDIREAGNLDEIETTLKDIQYYTESWGDKVPDAFQPFLSVLESLRNGTKPTLEQLDGFIVSANKFKEAYPAAASSIDVLIRAVNDLRPQLEGQIKQGRVLDEIQKQFTESAGSAAGAMKVLGFGFVGATTDAVNFSKAVDGAVGSLNTLSEVKPTFPMFNERLSFGGKPSGAPGVMGKTFGNLDPSYLKNEPSWVDNAIDDAINPVKVLGLGFVKATPEAKEFTEQLRGVESAVVDLSKLDKTFTIGGGGLNFGGLPNRPDLLGQLFGTDNPAALVTSQFSRDIYGKGQTKEPKPKAEKRTPEDRAEDRTQALKDEIAYNQQLAAVYDQGIEARNRVTASYEALKEARKTGLAEGSKEFQQFVDTQTKQNEVNLALEHRLDLYKQGQTLTESLMTDQERQNKLLADYKEMLDAGAIGTEIYKRAVAQATSENDSLAEAIGGVGDAINSGIQGATSFADALAKIGLQLLNLLSKGLFGSGPLGGLFNNLFGVAAGGILGTPAGAINAGVSTGGLSPGLGTGFRRSFAAGGWAGPGPVLVGEAGPEIANMPGRAYVSPANATRRMLQGGNDNRPIQVNVVGATGNAEVRQMVALGVDQAVRQSGRNVPGIQRSYNLRFGP